MIMNMKYGIITRSYSCINPQCSLEELALSIEKYYNGLTDIFSELTVSRMREIQHQIRTGKYTLSPFKLKFFKQIAHINEKNNCYYYLMHMLLDDSIIYYGILSPIPEDRLVLMALGGMLNTRIIKLNLLNSSSFGFKLRLKDYYVHICSSIEVPISRVYKLDMMNSLRRINKENLLTKLEPIVSNTYINQLLKEYLYNKIIHEGEDYFYIMDDIIPPFGFLTDILLNFALIELDNQFHQVFPAFSYTRYAHEVLVTTSQKESLCELLLFSLFVLIVSI